MFLKSLYIYHPLCHGIFKLSTVCSRQPVLFIKSFVITANHIKICHNALPSYTLPAYRYYITYLNAKNIRQYNDVIDRRHRIAPHLFTDGLRRVKAKN